MSDWVDFELEEAWYKKLEKNLRKALVYIITDSIYYRKSRFEFLLGDKHQAEKDAADALKLSNSNPRFQILAHLALCKIAIEKTDEAENVLKQIDSNNKFGVTNRDIRKGLRTRLAIDRGRYEDAFHLSDELVDKSSASYQRTRRDVLQGYLNNCFVPDSKRTELDAELTSLKAELMSNDEIELTPEIDSYFD